MRHLRRVKRKGFARTPLRTVDVQKHFRTTATTILGFFFSSGHREESRANIETAASLFKLGMSGSTDIQSNFMRLA